MWKAWKDTFNPLHKNLECKTRLTRGEDSFGPADFTKLIHNIVPESHPAPFHRETRILPQDANLSDDFDIHIDNF